MSEDTTAPAGTASEEVGASAWGWLMVYRALLWLYSPAIVVRLWWRGRKEPAYRQDLRQRLGRTPHSVASGGIWVHAVSAGETITVAPVVTAVLQEFPDLPVTLTALTPTGRDRAQVLLGDQVALHCLAPYDYRFAVRRFLDTVQPRLLVLTETELWPNIVHECHERGIGVVLLNARLSERSARRYGYVARLTRSMMSRLTLVLAQFDSHAERFAALGVRASALRVTGSVKFDLPAPDLAVVASDRRALGIAERPVWIAGSTHAPEEEAVLLAHARLRERWPDALLVLVPRHPQRVPAVAALVGAAHGQLVLTSQLPDHSSESGGGGSDETTATPPIPADVGVVVGDQMGELAQLYGLGDAAFVGGSLADVGGHNLMEPAIFGIPLCMGPSDRNFPDVAAQFDSVEALVRVVDAETLGAAMATWFADPVARQQAGAAAASVVTDQQGATARALSALKELIAGGSATR